MEHLEIELGPEIVRTYRNLSYDNWHALAEFVDNSTEAYRNNWKEIAEADGTNKVTVTISLDEDQRMGGENKEQCLTVLDDSYGMDEETLINAMHLGLPPQQKNYRSQFGLGLKTAACWFGDYWEVHTSRLGEEIGYSLQFDVERIASGDKNLREKEFEASAGEHFTRIKIFGLHRSFKGQNLGRVRTYLTEMFRRDLANQTLIINCFDKTLEYSYQKLFERFATDSQGNLYKRDSSTEINGKKVSGWIGVMAQGERKLAGLTLFKADRAISAPPRAYRPEILFGENSNTLVNQRLIGEFDLDEFEVSHIKNEVLFTEDEENEFQEWLLEEFRDLKKFASEFRASDLMVNADEYDIDETINEIDEELKKIHNTAIQNRLVALQIPDKDYLRKVQAGIVERTASRHEPSFKIGFDDFDVFVYLNSEISPNDPYVSFAPTPAKNVIEIVINTSHPYYAYLVKSSLLPEFVRQAIYDGISEWKCSMLKGEIQSDAVKKIKDDILRTDYSMD